MYNTFNAFSTNNCSPSQKYSHIQSFCLPFLFVTSFFVIKNSPKLSLAIDLYRSLHDIFFSSNAWKQIKNSYVKCKCTVVYHKWDENLNQGYSESFFFFYIVSLMECEMYTATFRIFHTKQQIQTDPSHFNIKLTQTDREHLWRANLKRWRDEGEKMVDWEPLETFKTS